MIIFTLQKAEKVAWNNYCNPHSVFCLTGQRHVMFDRMKFVALSRCCRRWMLLDHLQLGSQNKTRREFRFFIISEIGLIVNLRKSLSHETCAKIWTKKAPCLLFKFLN